MQHTYTALLPPLTRERHITLSVFTNIFYRFVSISQIVLHTVSNAAISITENCRNPVFQDWSLI